MPMAAYDPYERDYPRQYVREERREVARDRFLDPRDFPKTHSRDLVPRQDSDLSVEEIRRDFPPPSGRDVRRARSAGPFDDDYGRPRGYGGYDRYDSRYDHERDRDYDRRHRRGPSSSSYQDDERPKKDKAKTKQEKIIAAVAGAALLAGGKELYDRHEAKQSGHDVHRNTLSSAALAGFGALAGYQGAEFYSKQQAKKDEKTNLLLQRGRDGHLSEYYSDEEDGKEKKTNKNFLESALAATGLGAAVKQFTGGGDDKHSRGGSPTRSRAGSRAGSKERSSGGNKIQKAAMASLLAGATEAFRVSREPGGWRGEKAKRVLTAAAGAATVDAAHGGDKGTFGLAESVIGGLVGNRLINGSKRDIEEDEKTGRSRSRSRARSKSGGGGAGLAALATAGLGALGAKKVFDRSRSRSRSRSRRADSYDSRNGSPDRRRQRSRSRSVVDRARNSLAKLGIGSAGAAAADDHRRRDQDDFDDGPRHRSRRHSDDYDDRDRRDERDGRDYARAPPRGDRDRSVSRSSRRRGGRSDYGSETDLGDSDEDEKRAKRMRGKQLITSGLAGVATIHAAHEVFESLEKRKIRQKAVRDGHLSKVDAKKLKTKAIVKDATAIGIAAMGIKGALGNVKEAKEMAHECKNFQAEKAHRHELREKRRKRRELGPRRRSSSHPAPRKQRMIDWEDDIPRYDDEYYTRYPAAPPVRHRAL